MKNRTIKYQISARTDRGGRPDGVNEDSCGWLLPGRQETTENEKSRQTLALGEAGVVMIVADGMGGLNAGEVASRIAVDTVKKAFFADSEKIGSIAAKRETRRKYLELAIYDADKKIREHSTEHPECAGMGSTIIIAWIVGRDMTVSWCGDSRAYICRRDKLEMVSRDHSYVQELVDKGELDYEASFSHPNNNIITHCLGGGEASAFAESKTVPVCKGDVILLCSDGLSGVLFDDDRSYNGMPVSQENLCDILIRHKGDSESSVEALFEAAKRHGWYDNTTAIVCSITDGPQAPSPIRTWLRRYWWIIAAVIIGVCVGIWVCIKYLPNNSKENTENAEEEIIIEESNSGKANEDPQQQKGQGIPTKDEQKSGESYSIDALYYGLFYPPTDTKLLNDSVDKNSKRNGPTQSDIKHEGQSSAVNDSIQNEGESDNS